MDFSNFLWMRDELSLLAVILVLFLYDTFATEKSRRAFSWVACLLLAVQTAFLFVNPATGEAFGGMYQTSPVINIVKNRSQHRNTAGAYPGKCVGQVARYAGASR